MKPITMVTYRAADTVAAQGFDECRELCSPQRGERQVGGERGAIKEKTEWRDDSAGHLPCHPPQTAKYQQQNVFQSGRRRCQKAAYTRQSALALSNFPGRIDTVLCFSCFDAFFEQKHNFP